ncbi:MAG: NAD(P)H-hydrate dehydratase [Clostridium sp.]|nr:NAD(P)H-hydrate dehydratase [Clostridium sp.]MCM1398239.1 NAD(P)H-hydrate dehydratase [Clostridium sp.]MCM1460347.1 NAD(P)H-hydrate dehydratase [Bacteroides sp.]
MRYIANSEEMADIDKYTIEEIGIPQMVLMERAAMGVFGFVRNRFQNDIRTLIVVEGGNNGADGLALARIMSERGYDTDVYYVNDISKVSEGFRQQYAIAKKLGIKFIDEIVNYGYDLIVDAMFGVGLSRAVMGKHAETINLINEIKAYKLAVDISSGIDASTGFVLGTAFHADTTVTFGLSKLGHMMGIGNEYSGQVEVADIGFPQKAVEFICPKLYTYDNTDIDRLLPFRKSDSHKGSYGKIGVVGGCKNMAGAALFAAESAYRMGCGLVRICTPCDNREIMQTKLPEAMLTTYETSDRGSVKEALKTMTAWCDVIALGPGLGKGEEAYFIVERILKDFDKTIVADADALNILSENEAWLGNTKAKIIITPHLMEMSRLTGHKTSEIKGNKFEVARQFAGKHNIVVVLKDARTIVSNGEEQAYINSTGNNGMATGGSGDVLTGIIAGLVGQGMNTFEAAKLGVYMHGLAGQEASISMGRYSVIAGDIVRSITKVLENMD